MIDDAGPSNEYSGTIGPKMKKKKKGSDPEMDFLAKTSLTI